MKIVKNLFMGAVMLTSLSSSFLLAETPEVLSKHFSENTPIKAQLITIATPKEYGQFVQRLSESASKHPEWFKEHTAKATSASPFPAYDKKLGMTKEEYDNYLKLWDSREVKKLADVALIVLETGDGKWQINGTGQAAPLSLLRYDPEKNVFISANGELASYADVEEPEISYLGAWKGKEWRFQTANTLTKLRENIAIGTTADNQYSILIYRLQEIHTKSGKPSVDERLIIRFPAKPAK